MINNKYVLIIVLIIGLSFLPGCWSRVELDKRGIVSGIAIDKAKEEGKLKLTAEIIKPGKIKAPSSTGGGSGGSKEKAVWVVSSTGHTIFEAIRNFTMQVSRKLFWAHNRLIIISEDLAREGVYSVLDFFLRDQEGRARAWILISKGSEASEILKMKAELEKIPAKDIEELISARTVTSKAVAVDMHHFFLKLGSKTTSPVASRIEPIGQSKQDKKENKAKKVRLTGASVFKEDKLVGWLNRPATRGFLWITGEVESGIIVVKSPADNGKVSLEIVETSSKIEAELKNGELVMNIQVDGESNLGDQSGSADLTRPARIEALERRMTAVIRNEIKECLYKAQQEYKTDIFGFGEVVHRAFPDKWKKLKKNWEEIFPELKVKIDVEAKIRRPGIIKESINSK
ncbi:Ger(x)C family spore germination protein [Acetohalobium arabaticum]|uniref:Germination protein, Ger(X)C family n=1 Tax=Acetohalobium arabaticum (strain ATCC 49924 / DSM 5501 / Z-7288) TaxID=574087 RepID=D9QT71_ACEAZ|nr:Ger(x)C family spore germination protein [Acetohalobium arabaticum]ADL13571.1 germination protein, Ger(x)C family [Acetohalobium arabaticum DSM 5501]